MSKNLHSKEIVINKCKNRYYIELDFILFQEEYTEYETSNISCLLNIEYHEYINTAFKKFNATMDEKKEIYFTKVKDANNFTDWLNGFLIIDKLK